MGGDRTSLWADPGYLEDLAETVSAGESPVRRILLSLGRDPLTVAVTNPTVTSEDLVEGFSKRFADFSGLVKTELTSIHDEKTPKILIETAQMLRESTSIERELMGILRVKRSVFRLVAVLSGFILAEVVKAGQVVGSSLGVARGGVEWMIPPLIGVELAVLLSAARALDDSPLWAAFALIPTLLLLLIL